MISDDELLALIQQDAHAAAGRPKNEWRHYINPREILWLCAQTRTLRQERDKARSIAMALEEELHRATQRT